MKLRRIGAVGAAVVIVGTAAVGCGSDSGDAAEAAQILRFSTILAPDDAATEAIRRFAEEVEAQTAGSVKIDVFDSGSLFDQNQAIAAVQHGDLDMTYIGPQEVQEQVPVVGLLTVPYLIDSPQHLTAVMESEIGDEIFGAVVKELGIRPITSVYVGTRQLNLRDIDRKVLRPEDLAGVKLRVPNQESWIYMARALGAEPTPVAFGELYLALQTGTVDAQETALPLTFTSKFYEVTEQVSLTGHMVTDYWPTINEQVWQSLTDEQRRAITDAWSLASDEATRKVVAKEAELLTLFREEGLEVYEPDIDAFREHVQNVYLNDPSIVGSWPVGLLERVRAMPA